MGVEFNQDVALQVRNPSNLDQAGGYGQISMYFRTEDDNGFLAYVGPDAESRQQVSRNNYVAVFQVEVVAGLFGQNFYAGNKSLPSIPLNTVC